MLDNVKVLKDLVVDVFEKNKEKVAFLEKRQNELKMIKYGTIREEILALGTAMYYNEEIRNQKIAVIGENSSRWLVTYMAVMCGAGIIVPLDKELPEKEIVNLVKRAKIKMLVFSNKKKELIESIKKDLPKDICLVQMYKDETENVTVDDLIAEGRDLINKGKKEYIQKKINPEVFSTLMFTSGTSSKSKGVMLSNKNFVSNLKSVSGAYKELLGKRFFSFLPMHHTYEFTVTYLTMLSSGGTICICRGLKYIMEDLKEMQPECMCCVPLLLENIKNKLQRTIKKEGKENLVKNIATATSIFGSVKIDARRKILKTIHEKFGGKLKYILCGAASLEPETAEYMESLGFVVLLGYGLTEASPLIAATPLKNRNYKSVGKPIPNVEVRIDIMDKEENTGEIIAKGDNIMLGYYEDEKETEKALRKGWLYTGDLGKFDENGNLVITGRSKNVIVTNNGKNIYPEEIEAKINRLKLVDESIVYGYIDENKKIIVTARITLDQEYLEEKYAENRPTDEEIYNMIWEQIKKINETVPKYKHIKKLEIKKDSFIKTTTLKIKRQEEINNKIN